MSVPASREVRLQEGVTEGYLEDLLFQAHTGSSSDLVPLIARAELSVQQERSKAIGSFVKMLVHEMTTVKLVPADIHRIAENWHEEEILDIPHGRV